MPAHVSTTGPAPYFLEPCVAKATWQIWIGSVGGPNRGSRYSCDEHVGAMVLIARNDAVCLHLCSIGEKDV